MELLLSKMHKGIAYNVDEKQLFIKFRFERTTYQELYINFTGDINRYKMVIEQNSAMIILFFRIILGMVMLYI